MEGCKRGTEPSIKYSEFSDEEVCSCCLTGGKLLNMHKTFDNNGDIESYIEAINRCYNSQILDPLEPAERHHICEECITRLTESFNFKRQITEAQKSLHDYFDDQVSPWEDEKDDPSKFDAYLLLNCDDIKPDDEDAEIEHNYDDDIGLLDYAADQQSDEDSTPLAQLGAYGSNSVKVEDEDINPEIASRKMKTRGNHYKNRSMRNRPQRRKPAQRKPRDPNKPYNKPGPRPKKEQVVKPRKVYINREDAKVMEAMDKENIQCRVCLKKYRSVHHLSQHMNDHFVNYTCDICGKGHATSTRFMNHMRRHATGHFKCSVCGLTFDTVSRLDNHRAKHRSGKHLCHTCKRRFLSFYSLKKHLIKEHDEQANYPCKLCSVVCLTSGLLVSHVRTKHTVRERSFACEFCDKEFYEKRAVKKHMIIHTGQRNHVCTECNKAYIRKETLAQHMKVHRNIRDYVCSLCGQAFVQKCSLDWHMRKHGFGSGKVILKYRDAEKYKAMDKENIQCKVCQMKFRNLHNLTQHMNEHFINYTCEKCGKGFATKKSYSGHARRHLVGDFKCNVCNKAFDTISKRDNHRAKHRPGLRLCRRCPKQFGSFYTLQKHLVNDHGEGKGYNCEMCDVVCYTASSLVTHIHNNHTVRERKYGCEYCDKEFFSKFNLKSHMAVHRVAKQEHQHME